MVDVFNFYIILCTLRQNECKFSWLGYDIYRQFYFQFNNFLQADNFLNPKEWAIYFLYINIELVNEKPIGKCLTLN